MVSVNVEQQHINVKSFVRIVKSATEAYESLKKVYGDECLSHTQVFKWFRRFKEVMEEIRDDQHPSCPSTSKTDTDIKKVCEIVRQNHHLSIQAVAELTSKRKLFDRFYITVST
jgi:hypothetical protein